MTINTQITMTEIYENLKIGIPWWFCKLDVLNKNISRLKNLGLFDLHEIKYFHEKDSSPSLSEYVPFDNDYELKLFVKIVLNMCCFTLYRRLEKYKIYKREI